jgi:hypothetical protein
MVGGTLYGWGEKREVSYSVGGYMDIYWGTNTTLRVMGVLPGWLHHHRPWIDIYIYIYIHVISPPWGTAAGADAW